MCVLETGVELSYVPGYSQTGRGHWTHWHLDIGTPPAWTMLWSAWLCLITPVNTIHRCEWDYRPFYSILSAFQSDGLTWKAWYGDPKQAKNLSMDNRRPSGGLIQWIFFLFTEWKSWMFCHPLVEMHMDRV